MTECLSTRRLAVFGQSFTDTLTAVDSVELVPAVSGHKFRVLSALIQRDDVAGSDITISSNGVTVLICRPSDGVGELENLLIDGGDLTVDVTGAGTAFYNIAIAHI